MKNSLIVTGNRFNPDPYWARPITDTDENVFYNPENLELFDQNGYRLTQLEQLFARANEADIQKHRYEISLRQDWIMKPDQALPFEGPYLNHAFLFERKGYTGEALAQLEFHAKSNYLLYQVINIQPKWGIDFSMDYADRHGNVFEILHFEYDCFAYDEVIEKKQICEEKFLATDWEGAARQLIKHKPEWHSLDFFGQSDWKCHFFGLPSERFKEVIWK